MIRFFLYRRKNKITVVNHFRIKLKYELPWYIGSLTTMCRSDACY